LSDAPIAETIPAFRKPLIMGSTLRLHMFIAGGLLALSGPVKAENWPMWRGPRLDGTSLETNIPVAWSDTSNIVWKTALPGYGHASPIVWAERVFIVAVVSNQQARVLLCLDAASGELLWQQTVLTSPLEKKHALNSHASSTPATDGTLVFTAFLDRRDMVVAAHDFTGRQRWLVRPGGFNSMHGFCSSPILYKDLVIVNGDHDGDSYIVALSKADGRVIWRIPRENHTRSYAVPIIKELAGRTQMILSGDKCVASYEPASGQRHWLIDGPTDQFVASIVYNERADLLFVTGGFPDHHILAVKPDGRGNITRTDKIVWRTNTGVSYVPSPISEGNWFLVVSDSGVAHCFEAKTGKIAWAERLGEHHASLVSAGGPVYFLNDDGVMNVVRPGTRFERVARSELGEKAFASPAISDGRMFLRGEKHLWCVSGSNTLTR
jgi:hypothetical protein